MPVYKDKRRGTYYYSFSVNGQRVRSKDFSNKKDCDKALAKALLETDYIPSETYTFNQVAEIFLSEKKPRLKHQSYDRLETMIGHFLVTIGDVRVDRLTVQQYQKALKHLDEYTFHGKPLKNNYKNKIIRSFKQLCAFANKRYDLFTNIPDKFDPYRNEDKVEMKIITLDQFYQLLAVIDDPTYRTMFIVLYFMGFRFGEMNALQFQDIDFQKNTITINKTVTTKVKDGENQYLVTSPKTKSSVRTLPMPEIVSNALLTYRDNLPVDKEKLSQCFVFGLVRPIAESTVQKRKNDYFKKAGLEPIRIHDFRHSCASYLINRGRATPLLVSRWLGHANVTMTLNTYSHLWNTELEQIVNIINMENCTQPVRNGNEIKQKTSKSDTF